MVRPPIVVAALRHSCKEPGGIRRASRLTMWEGVMVEREPSNPRHSNAIRVLRDDNKFLGYLDRVSADQMAPHIDKGVIYLCSVITSPVVLRRGNMIGIKHDSVLIRCKPLPPMRQSKFITETLLEHIDG